MKHFWASIDAVMLYMPGLAGRLVPQQWSLNLPALYEQTCLMIDEATQRLKLAGLHHRTVAAGGLMQGFDYLAWSVVGLQVQSRLPLITMHEC